MKYTRYDLRRKKSENTIIILVMLSVLLTAFLLGTFISNLFMKKASVANIAPPASSDVGAVNKTETKSSKFIVIQGGKFAKAENIEKEKKLFIDYGTPFTIQDQDGTRVLLGIYNESESLKVINNLKTKNIDNSKITFELKSDNLCSEEIAAIVNAELEIINKLSDKGIKSIQTDDLKNWTNSLEKVDSKDVNKVILEDYKTHINALPKDLNNENTVNIEIYIYNLLKKLTSK
ncbi:hypothetical protein [Candidatus Clostridium stratigraminis]|uniref:SPOR domain-containing protein n=1 Tax=Candidatus Clostridium stratigraminis TaxID=3381661 RepID=A0ABW8T8U7_9CLOT